MSMQQLVARFGLVLLTALLMGGVSKSAAADILIPTGATWRYLDDGSDQGTAWIAPGFNDSGWSNGVAQLGYGDGDEATVVRSTNSTGARIITTYFRLAFTNSNPVPYLVANLRVRRDDGVVVYLNGREVFRDGLPAGEILFSTLAANAGDDGNTFLQASISPTNIVAGRNVLAAEIHQSSLTSSDISFDLELTASAENSRPTVALVGPTEGAAFTEPATITLTASAADTDGTVALVEFFQGTTKLGEDATAPFTYDWLGVPVGNYALRAIATDNLGAKGTSAVVNVRVDLATPPTLVSRVPAPGAVTNLTSITVSFSEPVSGVDAEDLLINGVPATGIFGAGTNYQFTFSRPAEGVVYIAWRGTHGIADFENPPKAFDPYGAGATWQYTLTDTVPPGVATLSPPAGATVNALSAIEVTFSEAVAGVDAADLRINGVAAATVTGGGAGPYRFEFAPPANGAVSVAWAAGHGIRDLAAARNPFAGGSWSYTLNTNAVWDGNIVISEIMYHPASERTADEWIELHNRGTAAVNLSGWRLSRAVNFTFPAVSLPAGGYLVVAADPVAFDAAHPSVPLVVGGWTGRLGNSGDEIELEDPSGSRIDLVAYADQGDWAVRTNTAALGWDWQSPADGLGRTLELRQLALPNGPGQNWLASTVPGGTPGAANSVATANLPPMILDVTHFPAVPRSTNAVTILARIVDESTNGLTVRLWRRDVTTSTVEAFTNVVMRDNGLSNDGAAGDGLYGVVLPAQPNGAITEFYVEAIDAAGNGRTWPAPGVLESGVPAQEANAFFQVDDEVYPGSQPLHRIVMRAQDRADFFNLFDRVQRNATFVTIDGAQVEVRHGCSTRRRGASSFGSTPPTMKFDIPRDRPWKDKTSLNLNSVNTYAQVLGSAVALRAGLPAPYTRAVQLRFNGVNYAPAGAGMFGSYAEVEVANSEWARDHFPNDPNGNVYSKRRPECGLNYQGTDPQPYINCSYDKESNASENDWTDLINLTFALDPTTTPANQYVQAVRANANVDQWMRYFSVLFLMNYNETAIANGADDDYDLYRGIVDPRFMILPHDFDSIFGSAGSTADNLFLAANVPNISRFLRHPNFEPLYYAEYRRQLAGTFSTNALFPIMDQVLGEWVSSGTINAMKANAAARIAYVTGALPPAPSSIRATVRGEPDSPTYLTSATLTVGGTDITQYRFRVNNGPWNTERPVSQAISLSGLTNGHYTVYVVGRDSAGTWQADADATISKTWAVLSSLRGVVLSEVLALNDGVVVHEGTTPDYIELFNAGAASVDLSGYRLTDDLDDPGKYTIPAGTTLAAGAYRVLFANNPDGTSGLHLGFGLDGKGDQVYLLDRATNGLRVIDSVRFGWQLSNRSIARLPTGQWGLASPTLGTANVAVATASSTAQLKINEWLASPGGLYVEDFLELYNPDPLPVNLGGLFLTDRPLGDPTRHAIAPLSFIEGFGYRAFIADGKRSAGPDHVDFALAGEGGEIGLIGADGTWIDSIVYGTQKPGISEGRSPNGSSRVVSFDVPTPGAGNPTAPAPVEPQTINLVPFNQVWRFNQDTNLDGIAWQVAGFNDSGWSNGPALFGSPVPGAAPVPVSTSVTLGGGRITYYFRTTFNLPNGVVPTSLQLSNIIDDGAIFYLNGQEIFRYNLPAGPVANATLATTVSGAPGWTGPIQLPATNLLTGANVLAVELHQGSATSSDVYFGSRLDAIIVTNNPALAGLRINEVLANARNSTNSDGTITDWVEIYNPSATVVDLAGMSFSDQVSVPRRWAFPTGTLIAAGGYRVVRFDPDLPPTTNAGAVLNTGFGLKASGDSLYLFNRPQSGGELLDSISFGIQAPDWSIGRVPSGGSNWVLTIPSAAGANLAAALGNPGLLRINEWMAAPASGPDWFELHNPSAQPVEISGLHLTDDLNNRLQYAPLPPRSFMAAGLTGFLKIIADNDPAAGPDHVPFALGRNGESLGIVDRFGTLIDQYTFGAQLTGVSQGRLPDGGTNIVSFPETSTPEESNYLPIPNMVINEVLTHTDLPLEDAIELRNTSASQVNIGGWFLSDARTALKKYRIPNNTIVAANGFKVFYEYQFNPVPNDPGSFSLSSAKGDEVYLSAADGQGQLTGYRAVVSFGAAANGVSFGRYITSALNGSKPEFVAMAQRTFGVDAPPTVDDFRAGTGAANSGPKVGPVVVSEIMYHPVDLAGGIDNLNDEYIELQNLTAAPVPLYDPLAPTNTWKLRDAVSFSFPTNTVIAANGFILVVAFNPADAALLNAFRTKFNVQPGAVILGPFSGKLDNSTDSVELARPDPAQTTGPDAGFVPYILVDKVKYFDVAPWPVGPDGTGQSLTRLTAANYGNDPVNWTGATPTPGPQGASADTDGDGMPNAWEIQYGLNPNVNDAAGDLDGDGMRNLDEYLAGTAPNSAASVLRVAISPGSPAVLQFNAASNVAYTVEFKGALGAGTWTALQPVPAGNVRSVQINLPTVTTNRFYRVRTP